VLSPVWDHYQTIWEKANLGDKGPEWVISKIFRDKQFEEEKRRKGREIFKIQMVSLVPDLSKK
jgi:hypothetical protein